MIANLKCGLNIKKRKEIMPTKFKYKGFKDIEISIKHSSVLLRYLYINSTSTKTLHFKILQNYILCILVYLHQWFPNYFAVETLNLK